MTRIFNYSAQFDDLGLTPDGLFENSGQFDSEQSPELLSIAREAFETGRHLTDIAGGIVLAEIRIDGDDLETSGLRLKPGRKITNLFRTAHLGAFFVCTAGKRMEQMAHTMMADGRLIEGYYLDLLGSLTVEKAMDRFQQDFSQIMKDEGLSISNRYSPGYCDWLVSEQHELFKLFPANFCGVSLSPSALMSPIKSVSGIIGVGETVRFREHHCDQCKSTTCIYRHIDPKAK